MGGEIQDTSKKSVLKAIEQSDLLQEVCVFVLSDVWVAKLLQPSCIYSNLYYFWLHIPRNL